MTKRVFLLMAAVGILCLSVGWFLGRQNQAILINQSSPALSVKARGVATIDFYIAEAASVTSDLNCLDTGRTEDAKYLMGLEQGMCIVTINDMLPNASESSRQTVTNLFKKIANIYVDRFSNYHGQLAGLDTNSIVKINDILARYK